MSNTKTVMSQASNTLVTPPVNVEDVFSTYLYDGNGSTQTITNGIDLAGEGGLVWAKQRDASFNNILTDTERGVSKFLYSDQVNAEETYSGYGVTSFNSDGFAVTDPDFYGTNKSGAEYASWTFRKAPKFFDVVTWTGNSTARAISHNLGCEVGSIFIKRVNSANEWVVYHRSMANNEALTLNTSDAKLSPRTFFDNTTPTSTEFYLSGGDSAVNGSGNTYVAYLFAHNDGDGEFGADEDADIIKCGSYTGNGLDDGPEIDLGFEPQWVMIKGTQYSDATGGDYRHWYMYDMMRGNPVQDSSSFNGKTLKANESSNESGTNYNPQPTPTGFKLGANRAATNYSGETYIYIAIRRGTKVPESGTEVFAPIASTASSATNLTTNFAVDLQIHKYRDGAADITVVDRLRGISTTSTEVANYLVTSSTAAENTSSTRSLGWDNTGFKVPSWIGSLPNIFYNFRRAPNFFDVVAYTGDGTAGRTVSHNLGVAPEMIWVKRRDALSDWNVYNQYVAADPETDYLILNATAASQDASVIWNDTAPSGLEFTLGNNSQVNASGGTYIAYLFASLAGVSKVGSYTGNGTSQTIDCGFSSGARFILIKRTDSTGDWYVWDTERGIVTGNDPYLLLNSRDAEVTSDDSIDPDSSGFIVNQVAATNINVSSASYIFYAVA